MDDGARVGIMNRLPGGSPLSTSREVLAVITLIEIRNLSKVYARGAPAPRPFRNRPRRVRRGDGAVWFGQEHSP